MPIESKSDLQIANAELADSVRQLESERADICRVTGFSDGPHGGGFPRIGELPGLLKTMSEEYTYAKEWEEKVEDLDAQMLQICRVIEHVTFEMDAAILTAGADELDAWIFTLRSTLKAQEKD